MNPTGGILGQSIWLVGSLLVAAVFGGAAVRAWITWTVVAFVALALALVAKYFVDVRNHDGNASRHLRKSRDVVAVAEALVPAFTWMVVLLIGAPVHTTSLVWSAPISVAAVCSTFTAAVVVLSSLIDWFFILPRRDGVVAEPPCRSTDWDFWRRKTETRFRHRMVAEATVMGLCIVTPIAVGISLFVTKAADLGSIRAVIGVAFSIGGIAGLYSKRRILHGLKLAIRGPNFAMGDTLTYVAPGSWHPTNRTQSRFLGLKLSRQTDRYEPGVEFTGYVHEVELGTIAMIADPEAFQGRFHSAEAEAVEQAAATGPPARQTPCLTVGYCLGLSELCARKAPAEEPK